MSEIEQLRKQLEEGIKLLGVEEMTEISLNFRTEGLATTLYHQGVVRGGATPAQYGAGLFQMAISMAVRSPEWARAFHERSMWEDDQMRLDSAHDKLETMEQFAYSVLAVKLEHGEDED